MKFHLALTTYNRADALKSSLRSLAKTEIVNENPVLHIYDDCSTDWSVKAIIDDFVEKTAGKFEVKPHINQQNIGCDRNMCQAISNTFAESGSDPVITIDSDVLYNRNWLKFMEDANVEMINNPKIGAITAYDSCVHQVKGSYNHFLNEKGSIGGLCALLNKEVFSKLIEVNSWDWEFVKICKENGYLLLCSKMGLIQHIGMFGAHSPDGRMYDFSHSFVGEL